MRRMRTGRKILLIAGLITLSWPAWAWSVELAEGEPPEPESLAPLVAQPLAPPTLVELAAQMKSRSRASMLEGEKLQLIQQIEASFQAAIGPDGKGLKVEDLEPLLYFAQILKENDLRDRPRQTTNRQRMILAGLTIADQISANDEVRLLGQLQLDPKSNLNSQGQPVSGAEWQELRKQLLAYRLLYYRRCSEIFDPVWMRKPQPIRKLRLSDKFYRRWISLDGSIMLVRETGPFPFPR